MLRMQPQCIIAESDNHYRVRFDTTNGPVDYTFSITWSDEIGIINCDQREFYFNTYDDPATKLVLNAIDLFDDARRCHNLESISISAVKSGPGETREKFVIHTKDAEEVTVSIGPLHGDQLMVNDHSNIKIASPELTASDKLIKAILAFSQARNFDYSSTNSQSRFE